MTFIFVLVAAPPEISPLGGVLWLLQNLFYFIILIGGIPFGHPPNTQGKFIKSLKICPRRVEINFSFL